MCSSGRWQSGGCDWRSLFACLCSCGQHLVVIQNIGVQQMLSERMSINELIALCV